MTPMMTRLFGRDTGWALAVTYLAVAGMLAPVALDVWGGGRPTWSVMWVPELGVTFSLAADGLGIIFAMLALLIGAVVLAYSSRYLAPGRQLSFFLVMVTFTLAMLGLVFAADLLLLFICWELTSLASFLLIARSGVPGQAASMRTLFITFVGGVLLLIAVALTWIRTGTTALDEVFAHGVWGTDPVFTAMVAALVALAAMTKAAQFPFHVWLPDAMAAITPVSAYLHAAAVVKAGIFLLMRFTPLFHDVTLWRLLLLSAGLTTTFVGAWFALQATDLKRLMAYSTVSQLGLIVVAIGVGTPMALAAAVIHTITHALFKSGLFMMVGVIDHATHTRDLRRLPTRLFAKMPVTFVVTVLGVASMAGLPPLLGFVSKEAILAATLEVPGSAVLSWVVFLLTAASAVATMAYCVRIVFGAFVDGPDKHRPVEKSDPWLIGTAALPILATVVLVPLVWLLDVPVASAVAAAMGSADTTMHFSLWHGLTPELLATMAIMGLGLVIALRRRALFAFVSARVFPFDGAKVIAGLNRVLRRTGQWFARLTGADDAGRNVLPVLALLAALGVLGTVAVSRSGLPPQRDNLSRPIDFILLVLFATAVLAICVAKNRLAAVVALTSIGILSTVQILALGAPDVALTQLLVESLSLIVIMLVLQRLPVRFPVRTRRNNLLTLAVAVSVGAAVASLTWALNARRAKSAVAQYFLDFTEELTGGFNVVNVILVEFRALDTMGELTVLGMAGVAMVAVFSTVRDKYLDPGAFDPAAVDPSELPLNRDPSSAAHRAITVAWPNTIPLHLMVRVLTPVLSIISLMLFWRGHNSPGGGFNAALVAAAIVGLIYLSTSYDRAVGPPRLPLWLISGGIVAAITTGLANLVVKGSFLQPSHFYVAGVDFSTSLLFDAGVYSAVLGLIILSFNLLGSTQESTRGEGTRERVDESAEGELAGPLDTVRGERPGRVAAGSTFLTDDQAPRERRWP
ncbi:MAG: DUF4040 family protein [Propionibacteriaceae bacterium]|nr:DUF4040 family protein [Propionibacteriaceae bacterium]